MAGRPRWRTRPNASCRCRPPNTEILFDLGLGSKIVGVDDYSDYPAEAKNITHVSGFAEVSYEKITAANPDVIFAEDIVGEEAVTKLRDMGFQVVEVKNSNLTMIRKTIELFGKATNTSDKAAALVNSIDTEVATISAKTAGLNESQKPRVLLVTGLFPDETIYPFGNGTYGDELLALAGARNAAGNISMYGVMSHEAILKEDPDMIIVPVDDISRPSYDAFKNGTMAWATGLSAYKNGKVYEVDANIMNRPSPRLADAGLIIARIVHPGAIPINRHVPQEHATSPFYFFTYFCVFCLSLSSRTTLRLRPQRHEGTKRTKKRKRKTQRRLRHKGYYDESLC